jgi:LacI family transcriptional regulator
VTAIIGVNDMTAIGVVQAIKEKGLRIPEDLSVCGFDNILLSGILSPKLTTIDHHTRHKARLVLDILIDKINHVLPESDVLSIEYEPRLIVRESTGPAKTSF